MKKLFGWVLALGFVGAPLAMAPPAEAQVSVGVGVGPAYGGYYDNGYYDAYDYGAAPVCPYGYYAFPPYNCAPWGYYGPEWFNGGIFIGAGPWFHGPRGFYGHVDHHFDPHYGYHGPYPGRGEHPDPHHFEHFDSHSFHGNAMHDGMGHEHPGGGHPR